MIFPYDPLSGWTGGCKGGEQEAEVKQEKQWMRSRREATQILKAFVATDLQFKLVLREACWPGSLAFLKLFLYILEL